MNLKTILIAFVLLFLAFFTRYTSYLDTRILEGRQNLAFQTMGTGGDPDYQMRCGLQFSQGQPNEALTHYDYIFLCPYMGLVFMTNTLINGLELIVFINILIGSVVSITPFLLLAYLNKNTIGGIITSLILIFNPTMIQNADGRFYIYPLVTFFFTLFYICLFFAIKTKNIGWLILLGIMGILHDLNKPFMYTNDLILFIALPFLLLVKKTSFIKKFPYISFSFHKESIYKIFIPTTIYFIGIISYEFIHTYFANAYFFLSDLFIDTGGPSSKDFILKESLAFPGSKLQQFKNILSLIFKGTRLLLELIPNSFFWLLTAIMLYIVSQRK